MPFASRARAPIPRQEILVPATESPTLSVVVDTEEEFDWSRFDRDATAVSSMDEIGLAQDLFDEFGLVPTYVVDTPIVTHERGYRRLREYARDGRAVIGAHLHPWVAPPFEETVGPELSYPGNLPEALEREKLRRLRDRITEVFGVAPTLYKAGRYGAGPNTPQILADLGFEIDLSACPSYHFGRDGGPDYLRWSARPYWFGPDHRLLGLPTTAAFLGVLRGAPALHELAHSEALRWTRMPGVLSRLGLIERIRLSPEGFALEDLVRLTKALLAGGVRNLSLSFHSPSVALGHTTYVQSETDRRRFFAVLRGYFAYFFGQVGGRAQTPHLLRDRFLAHHYPTQRATP